MKAIQLVKTRVVCSVTAFAELVLWQVPASMEGSVHLFRYRLAYLVNGVCVLRFGNEAGKGDHRHRGEVEGRYRFKGPEQLVADFQTEITRWDRENSDA